MGLLKYIVIISLGLATHVQIQPTTGTAFIEASKPATFYQDTARVTVNIELDSPRILLDYAQYTECDNSFDIDGVPMCRHMFDEFDNFVFEFLDLDLVKTRKQEQQNNKMAETVSLVAKQKALRELHQQMATELNALKNQSKRNRREIQKTISVSNQAKWLAMIDHIYHEFNLTHTETCTIMLTENHRSSMSDEHFEECKKPYPSFPESYKYLPEIGRRAIQQRLQNLFKTTAIDLEKASNAILKYTKRNNLAMYFWTFSSTKNELLADAEVLQELSNRAAANAKILTMDSSHTLELITSADRNSTHTEILSRSRRGGPLIAAAVAAVGVGTSVVGYFIGKAATESTLEEIREDLEKNKKSILDLDKAIQLTEDNIAEVVSILKQEASMVLTGKHNLPFDIRFEASQIQQGLLETRFDIRNALHIARLNTAEFLKFEQTVLTLQNYRLPLDTTFLLGLRAQCLAIQTKSSLKETRFCNELAFFSTRWDTGLQFEGIGITYLDKEETMIKSIIYSITVDVPIPYADNLDQIDIVNLGRFDAPELINKIKLPAHSIKTKSGIFHPFLKKTCIDLQSSIVCPTIAIGTYDECLHSIITGSVSPTCQLDKIPTKTTCIGEVWDKFAIVSMLKPATVHYGSSKSRHYHKNIDVQNFAIVNRTEVNGIIFCEKNKFRHIPPEFEIPPRPKSHMANFTIAQITTTEHVTELKTSNDRLSDLEKEISLQKVKLATSERELRLTKHHTNSTVEIFKSDVQNAIRNIPSSIKEHLKNFLMPILTPIVSILAITFIAVISMMYIFKRCQRKLQQREVFTHPGQPIKSNRTDESAIFQIS